MTKPRFIPSGFSFSHATWPEIEAALDIAWEQACRTGGPLIIPDGVSIVGPAVDCRQVVMEEHHAPRFSGEMWWGGRSIAKTAAGIATAAALMQKYLASKEPAQAVAKPRPVPKGPRGRWGQAK